MSTQDRCCPFVPYAFCGIGLLLLLWLLLLTHNRLLGWEVCLRIVNNGTWNDTAKAKQGREAIERVKQINASERAVDPSSGFQH